MKKLLFVMACLVFLVSLAEAKTILYVTDSSTDDSCDYLSSDDEYFCSRMEESGYDVRVINELHVEEGSDTWNEYVGECDMIFLGSVSEEMIDTNELQEGFCGNIVSKLGDKPIFMTKESAVYKKPSLEGCAFYENSVSEFDYDNNTCRQMNFKISKEGYLTEMHELGEAVNLYSNDRDSSIRGESDDVWLFVECIPPEGPIDFYPVVSASENAVFWGLSESNELTEEGWDIFDRAVEYLLGDIYWNFDSVIIPSAVTKGEEIWIFTNASKRGVSVQGDINVSLDNEIYEMEYSEGLWIRKGLQTSQAVEYDIGFEGWSEYGYRGSSVEKIKSGYIDIYLKSEEHFKPNKDYMLALRTGIGSKLYQADVSYKIRNYDTLGIIYQGEMDCSNGVCNKTIDDMPEEKKIILEIVAENDNEDNYGGKIFVLESKTAFLTIDKEIYVPGETVSIKIESENTISSAGMVLTDPEGDHVSLPLQKESKTLWAKNYSLGSFIGNGTYVLKIEYEEGGEQYYMEESFQVIAWDSYAYLNQKNFYVLENVEITVGISDSYLSNLITNITVIIFDAEENIASEDEFSITGNEKHISRFSIPSNYSEGKSKITVNVVDTYGRNSTHELEFSINEYGSSPSIFVSPSTISETIGAGKTLRKTITIENSDNEKDITKIITEISSDIKKIVSIKSQPKTIKAGEKFETEITINTKDLSPGTYKGTISFQSQVGSDEVTINVKIPEDIPKQAVMQKAILDSFEKNITNIEDLVDASKVKRLLDTVRELLDDASSEYQNEKYQLAESKYELALSKMREINPLLNELYAEIPDYSGLVWMGALGTVGLLLIVTVVKYWKKIKKLVKRKKGKKKKENEEEELVYFDPKGGHYRTEYY